MKNESLPLIQSSQKSKNILIDSILPNLYYYLSIVLLLGFEKYSISSHHFYIYKPIKNQQSDIKGILMKKSIEQVFTQRQQKCLKSKLWWVANRDNPYLIKFAIDQDSMLLQLTDLKSVWANRFTSKQLMEQKKMFAPSLQIDTDKSLLQLFESVLSASDIDARYNFNEAPHGDILFSFNKRIEILDFKWTFRLERIGINIIDLVCMEIINPMNAMLEAQLKRIDMLKKKFDIVQKDYMRKMTEMEKALYRSPLNEDREDWKKLVPQLQKKRLNFIIYDDSCKFFFERYQIQQMPVQKVSEDRSQKKQRTISRRVMIPNDNGQIHLARQLQRQRQKRKQNVIDFI